jgi:hypothetical protein
LNKHHHIIGIGRSGTTLLQSMLNAQPEVWAGPENYFIPFFYHAWKNKTEFSRADLALAARFHKAFGILQPYVGFTFDEAFFVSNIEIKSYEELIIHTYRSFVDQLAPTKDAIHFINKNPLHSYYLDALHSISLDTKFIWMMRDYRANVNSRKNSVHLKSTSAHYNSLRWIQFEQRIASFQKQHPNRVFIVRYEDLVQAPDQTLAKVCDFLEIPVKIKTQDALAPYQALFQHEVKTQYEQADRMNKRFGDLSKPIHTAAVEAWKSGLTTQELEVCEVIAGRTGSTYGYQTTLTIPMAKRRWIEATAILYAVKTSMERAKDAFFNRLPIRLKVSYFERWVLRIDKKRKNHVA